MDSGEAATLEEGRCMVRAKSWVTYEECAALVRELELTSLTQFREWCKENPEERQRLRIPTNPKRTYHLLGWSTWSDFFGKAEAHQAVVAKQEGDAAAQTRVAIAAQPSVSSGEGAALNEENEARRKNVSNPGRSELLWSVVKVSGRIIAKHSARPIPVRAARGSAMTSTCVEKRPGLSVS